ncbi:MAG TPA: acyl carrier protein [Terrimicrobiaceae bacterium]
MDLIVRLETIFKDIFQEDAVHLTPDTTADDIPGWDSFTHINLMFSIEQAFGVSFTGEEIGSLSKIGDLVDLLKKKGV